MVTILFIPLSAAHYNFEADWAEVAEEVILRRCPICSEDSIIGHGRRRKQAHDEHHDWIGIRRGFCNLCGKTFTFPHAVLAFAALETAAAHHPCLGMSLLFSYAQPGRQKQCHGRGS